LGRTATGGEKERKFSLPKWHYKYKFIEIFFCIVENIHFCYPLFQAVSNIRTQFVPENVY